MFNGRLLLFSVKGAFIQSKTIPNKTISSTGYWMERWDCPAVHHKMKLGEASRHVANFMLKPQLSLPIHVHLGQIMIVLNFCYNSCIMRKSC